MSLTARIVELQVIQAGKLGLRDKGEALTTYVLVGRSGFEREDVRLAILRVPKH